MTGSSLLDDQMSFDLYVSAESQAFSHPMRRLIKVGLNWGIPTSITETNAMDLPDTATEQFHRLAAVLQEECAFLSSMDEVAQHPAYRQIVEMGDRALPLILRELDQGPAHWFWALHEITRENPVLPNHRGYVKEMAQDWLNWARRTGLRW